MYGLCLFAALLCVFVAVNFAKPVFDDRIQKRWAFFANNDENLKVIPTNCDDIVQEYSDGKLVMYEYKIKMAKCIKGKGEAKSTITSKYEDDDQSNEDFFRKALKYTEDYDDEENDDSYKNDDDQQDDQQIGPKEKKSEVPNSDSVNTQMDTTVPQQQAASYYPSTYQGQGTVDQTQVPVQTNAAFSQNAMYNQAAPAQQNYNYYTRSNIPAAPQAPVTNQWNTPVAPAQSQLDSTKKDTLPAAPSNDPFAQFMNIQSSPDTSPQEIQQRSDIPTDQGSDQLQAAQSYMPANQQAYFRDQYRLWSPEDDGIFPENP